MSSEETHWAEVGRETAPYGQGDEWYDMIMEQPLEERENELNRLMNLQSQLGESTVAAAVEDSGYDETEIERTESEPAQELVTEKLVTSCLLVHCHSCTVQWPWLTRQCFATVPHHLGEHPARTEHFGGLASASCRWLEWRETGELKPQSCSCTNACPPQQEYIGEMLSAAALSAKRNPPSISMSSH